MRKNKLIAGQMRSTKKIYGLWVCPKCGRPLGFQCPRCGKRLVEPVSLKALLDSGVFDKDGDRDNHTIDCDKCGKRVRVVAATILAPSGMYGPYLGPPNEG